MTDITFVRTRHQYDSYRDYFELVRLSNFPTIYVDELDVSQEGVYIVCPMNGEWRPHIDNQRDRPRNAHLILWNLERPSAGKGDSIGNYAKANRDLLAHRYIDEIWVSDAQLADETMFNFIVLGSDEGLGQPGDDKRYNLTHMSYTGVPRRPNIYKNFAPDEIGPNAWPPERDEILKASRFALNVHQDNHPFQEPLRFALFAAYGLPIVSESIYNPAPWVHDETIIITDYDGLVGKLRQMIDEDYSRWRELGLRAREMMCKEYQFGKVVRETVAQRVGGWR